MQPKSKHQPNGWCFYGLLRAIISLINKIKKTKKIVDNMTPRWQNGVLKSSYKMVRRFFIMTAIILVLGVFVGFYDFISKNK